MPNIAKIVLSDEQIVHLPADYFSDGEELEISRDGDAVVLRPLINLGKRQANLRTTIANCPGDDTMAGGREQVPLLPDDLDKSFD